jgi:hypothetical protein
MGDKYEKALSKVLELTEDLSAEDTARVAGAVMNTTGFTSETFGAFWSQLDPCEQAELKEQADYAEPDDEDDGEFDPDAA